MAQNSTDFAGNITATPELRHTGKTDVLNFCVAINERRRDAESDEWVDAPVFVDVAVFGKRAVALSERLEKGMFVVVHGRLAFSKWVKDGQTHSKLSVVADDLHFVKTKKREEAVA